MHVIRLLCFSVVTTLFLLLCLSVVASIFLFSRSTMFSLLLAASKYFASGLKTAAIALIPAYECSIAFAWTFQIFNTVSRQAAAIHFPSKLIGAHQGPD